MSARGLCSLLIAAALLVPVSSAAPRIDSIDLLRVFAKELPRLRRTSPVPILLPRSLVLAGAAPKLYASGVGAQRGWALTLAGDPRCGGANACFVASFVAERGRGLPRRANVRLADGTRALYVPIGCGASCSPATFFFVKGGVLYTWQVKDAPRNARAVFVQMAGEAIRAGPR